MSDLPAPDPEESLPDEMREMLEALRRRGWIVRVVSPGEGIQRIPLDAPEEPPDAPADDSGESA